MKSKNEEYLDNLLQSLKKDSNSGLAKIASETSNAEDTSDLGEMIGSSAENNDLQEIGGLLEKLDGGELLDSEMEDVLNAISMPVDNSIPKYTVGDEISDSYEKDADEIALDEAIAHAEAMQSELENFDEETLENTDSPEVNIPEMPPIDDLSGKVPSADTGINESLESMNSENMDFNQNDLMDEIAPELSEDDSDALLEVAPEIPIPDDYSVESTSDSHESPEEILDDMMRNTPAEALDLDEPLPTAGVDEMLNIDDMLDQQDEASENASSADDMLNLDGIDTGIAEAVSDENISLEEGMIPSESIPEAEVSLEGIDLGTPEAEAEISIDGIDLGNAGEAGEATASLDGVDLGNIEAEVSADEVDLSAMEAATEGIDLGDVGETGESEVSIDGIDLGDVGAEASADEIDLSAMEAAMDGMDLEAGEAGESEAPLEGADLGDIGDAGESEASLDGMDLGDAGEEAVSEEPIDEAALEESLADFAEAMSQDEASADEAVDDSDMNLESMSAELDDLLKEVGDDGADISADDLGGEIGSEAELDNMLADLSADESDSNLDDGEDVDMPDLDAIMNSLASDEVEDLENTAHIDEKEGGGADEINLDDLGMDLSEPASDEGTASGEEEPSPEEIMGALDEESLDEIGLSDDLPDPDEVDDNGGDYDEISLHVGGDEPEGEGEEGGKKKKRKRKGLLALIFGALFKVLTQTDEDLNPAGEGGELASLTDDNQQVLDELAAEDGKKAKKEKKKKEKKEKKPKEKKPPKEKKQKPPKEKKPKKEKKKKVDDGQPEKALAPKKVAIAMLFAFSLGFLCCLPSVILPGRILTERAQNAFDHQDYQATYKLLYGKTLNEEQTLIYNQARVLSCANHYLSSYNNYIAMNMKDEALDSLLKAMRTKKSIMAEAEEFQVAGDVENVYSNIESILADNYGLTIAEVDEINAIKEIPAYTKRVMEVTGSLDKLISSISN